MKKIYFINGMPRSGSTLLCNILAQNPDFHVTPTSGLSELIWGVHQFWKNNPVIKASEAPEKQLPIIRDLLQSYHQDTHRPIVFNKSRGWTPKVELVENALQHPIKILTTTRKITCILASLEKLYRKEIKNIKSPMEVSSQMMTLEGRLQNWTSQDGMVGGTFNSIRDAIMRGHRDRFFFIDYDQLTSSPKLVINSVYKFLEQPVFEHNFNDVQQYTIENDAEHGFTDLHTIRPEVKPNVDDSEQILGQTLHQQFSTFHYNF